MKIVHAPHVVLSAPALPVGKIDKKLHQLVKEMNQTLNRQKDPEGVGLAAPQVGLPLQLFIIKKSEKSSLKVFINPKIEKTIAATKPKTDKKTRLEGCLSIPRIWGKVTRSKKVQLTYTNLEGETKTEWFSAFEATIIEHEMDHLNGILFTRRVFEQENILYQETDGELEEWKV